MGRPCGLALWGNAERVRSRGWRRGPVPPRRSLAPPGDGRRDSRPRVQPRVPSAAHRTARRILGRGPRRPAGLLRRLWRRDLGRAAPQRQWPARGYGPPGQVLHDYFAWATTTTMSRYHESADEVPEGMSIPKWSWDGLQP